MRDHYKSWGSLKARLERHLADSLKGKITYFYTSYHKVHNVYGRASIRLNGQELICFSWINTRYQDIDIGVEYKKDKSITYEALVDKLREKWNANNVLSEYDFLAAVQKFFKLTIKEAQASDDNIIKILAVLDKRTGKRTLQKMKDSEEYLNYPQWVQDFYKIRFDADGI